MWHFIVLLRTQHSSILSRVYLSSTWRKRKSASSKSRDIGSLVQQWSKTYSDTLSTNWLLKIQGCIAVQILIVWMETAELRGCPWQHFKYILHWEHVTVLLSTSLEWRNKMFFGVGTNQRYRFCIKSKEETSLKHLMWWYFLTTSTLSVSHQGGSVECSMPPCRKYSFCFRVSL